MFLGIVGLPNVGKSTLFNAITKAGAESANYPFCTIDPNVGVVDVPDLRLKKLALLYNPEKVSPASANFVDIAGLVKGASKGEGLGNKFLSNIRSVNAVVHVVRCFADENIIHVEKNIDPMRDIEIINLELIFSDLDLVEKRISKVSKNLKLGEKNKKNELDTLNRIKECLLSGKLAKILTFDIEEKKLLSEINLITLKPTIYALNVSEDHYCNNKKNDHIKKIEEYALLENSETFVISAKIEEELSNLDAEERQLFLEEMEISESGLDRFIKKSYSLLDLISYFTAGTPEVKAWTINNGTNAKEAAGKIHSDIERGFIRAEVIGFDEFIECGNIQGAKLKGLIRSEGKDYTVKDGDIIHFLFNV